MLHGLVLFQIASLVGCADNSSSTIGVGWKWFSVILVTRESKSMFASLISLQTVCTLAINFMGSPASKFSSYDK